jgi:asparagine synthase (glutamine-hydrolysing)
MCAITGVFAADRSVVEAVRNMTDALRHRGPDDEGYLLVDTRKGETAAFRGPDTLAGIPHATLPSSFAEGVDLAFGHRRLAIIDLGPGGHGPMASPEGHLWITYNGEVYNYLELREELKRAGRSFRTASDTEVVLAALDEWGPRALEHFNGMWAFALYDARRRRLFCARDRFGVKPFYYYWDGEIFAFASEIKGLRANPRVPRHPHLPTLHGFLVHGTVDETDQTFYEKIRSLAAGHHLTLELDSRRLKVERWYDVAPVEPPSPAELRELLEDAVRLRLRSDVDVGTCLSGGLDSSSIVALTARMRQATSNGHHHSFSVVYPDAGLDESAHVARVVEATGVHGQLARPTAKEFLEDLTHIVRSQDQPFPSTGVYTQWRVMKLARAAGVKVLLDGQGADEVLAGYHYHYGPYLAELAAEVGWWTALVEARKASRVTGHSLAFLLGLLAYHRLALPESVRSLALARLATHRSLPRRFLDRDFAARAGGGPGERHAPRSSLGAERRANLFKTSLPALLRYEDHNSMAFSIEARTPFLDYRLVEKALALPARSLIRDGWTKAIMREAMTGVLPESVRLRRDKLGFPTPERRFLVELAPQVRGWLGPGARIESFLNPGVLRTWLAEDDQNLARRPGLWRLISLELWLRS